MKFIHIADVHLGASPETGSSCQGSRARELWESLENIIRICNKRGIDLLLIAGDLFHRQPLLRELKEVNELFKELTHTKVVFIAGNHDYLKPTSFYRTFQWCENIFPLMDEKLRYVEFPELNTCVYGFSYGAREIEEPLFDQAFPEGRQAIEILLGHGGDQKHIPFKKGSLMNLGYDYIALGHIHRPGIIVPEKIYYSGSLEPTDINDTGVHGYIHGTIVNGKVSVEFIPTALREYVHVEIKVDERTRGRDLRERIESIIKEKGSANIYRVILTGERDPEREFDLSAMDVYGNIVELLDQTRPAYDYQKLASRNANNLLGKFIMNMQEQQEDKVRQQALAEGVSALLESLL